MADQDTTHETAEGVGIIGGGGADSVERARALHHLATADPEPERDGLMTGPAHEAKYNLERADGSAEYWRSAGVHPFENRALQPGDEGYVAPDEDVDQGAAPGPVGPTGPIETTAAPRASDSKK